MADALLHCPTCGDGPFSTPQARAGHEQRHVMERLRALEAQSRETTAVEALRGSGAQSERQPPLSAAEPEGPQPAPETGAPRPLRGSAAPEGIADAAVHDGVGVAGGEDRDDEPVDPEPDE